MLIEALDETSASKKCISAVKREIHIGLQPICGAHKICENALEQRNESLPFQRDDDAAAVWPLLWLSRQSTVLCFILIPCHVEHNKKHQNLPWHTWTLAPKWHKTVWPISWIALCVCCSSAFCQHRRLHCVFTLRTSPWASWNVVAVMLMPLPVWTCMLYTHSWLFS